MSTQSGAKRSRNVKNKEVLKENTGRDIGKAREISLKKSHLRLKENIVPQKQKIIFIRRNILDARCVHMNVYIIQK